MSRASIGRYWYPWSLWEPESDVHGERDQLILDAMNACRAVELGLTAALADLDATVEVIPTRDVGLVDVLVTGVGWHVRESDVDLWGEEVARLVVEALREAGVVQHIA